MTDISSSISTSNVAREHELDPKNVSAGTAPPKRGKGRGFRVRESMVAVAFLAPTVLLVALFAYLPAGRAAVTAFTTWDGFNAPTFTGISNFVRAFNDPVLHKSTLNVAIWTAIGVPMAMIPSFIVAELIFRLRSERLQYFWRAVFVAPIILPPVVGILIWQFLYGGNGPINYLLESVGLSEWARAWLVDPDFALWALIFLGFPWISAFNVLIFYAGLKAIPLEVFEAAALDGAGRLRMLFRIEIPLTGGQWKLLLVLSIIAVTQNLVTPLLLTNGGPNNASNTPVLYMYQEAIYYGRYGYGMTIGTLLFVIVLGLSIISMRIGRRKRSK